MATFTGQLISATYDAIIKTIDNDAIGSTAKQLTDGLGNVTPLYVSNTQIGIGITPTEALDVSGNIKASLSVIATTFSGDLNGTINTATTGVTQTAGNDTTKIATTAFVQESHVGKPTGSGTGGKIALWSGSGSSTVLTDSSITEESTQYLLNKDIRIFDPIPAITLQDSDSSGSASLGDIQWLDNAASQRAIISLNNAVLGIMSKHGGLTLGSNSSIALSIDGSQNAAFTEKVTSNSTITTDGGTTLTTKDYVDSNITAQDLDFSGTSGTGSVDLDSQTFAVIGTANEIETSAGSQQLQIGLPDDVTIGRDLTVVREIQTFSLDVTAGASIEGLGVTGDSTFSGTITAPTFIGDLNGTINTLTTAVTQSASNNSTKVATTAYVDTSAGLYLPLAGGTLTGDLGIGGAPDQKLTLKDSGNLYMHIDRTSGAQVYLGSTDTEGLLTTSNSFPFIFKTNNTTALTLDTSQNSIFTGNVTVGTTAASNFVLSLRGGVGGFLGWDDSANKTILQAPNTRQLSLRVNSDTFGAGTEALLIDSSGNSTFAGNVGINASDPVKTLDVRGQLAISNSASSYWYMDREDSTGNFKLFDDADNAAITVDVAQNVGIGGTKANKKLYVLGDTTNYQILAEQPSGYAGLSIKSTTVAQTWSWIANDNGSNSDLLLYGGAAAGVKLTIDSSGNSTFAGNVGIGSAPGSYKLDVTGNGRFSGFVEMAGGGAVYQGQKFYLDGGGDTFLESPSSNIITFTTNAVERMRLKTPGTTIQDVTLQLKTDGASSNAGIMFINSGNTSSFNDIAGIASFIESGDAKGNLQFWTRNTDGANTDLATRMRISSDGNIFMDSPKGSGENLNLVISDTTTGYAAGTGGSILFQGIFNSSNNLGGAAAIQASKTNSTDGDYSYDLDFYTRKFGSAIEKRMRIDSSGNVGIGFTGTNSYKLYISDPNNRTMTTAQLHINGAGYSAFHFLDGSYYTIQQNSASRALRCMSGLSGGVLLTNGSVAWQSASDEILKENIKPLENVLDKIKDYRCVEYNFKNDKSKGKNIGFIAQDWENDFAPIVNKDEEGLLGMKYTETIPVLLKAIQELTAKVEMLEKNCNCK